MPAISLKDQDIAVRSPRAAGARPVEHPNNRGSGGFFLRTQGGRELEQLWQKAGDLGKKSALEGSRVCVLGFDQDRQRDIEDIIRNSGIATRSECGNVCNLRSIDCRASGISHVLVNVDAFPDLDSAVSELITFRQRAPRLSVILVSSGVSGDDFGSDRRPIADATLRWPLSSSRLKRALRAATGIV
jgi:hypothetical protein